MERELSEKEKLFCALYAMLPSPADAARKAGYRTPERQAAKLLRRDEIRREIKRLQGECRLDAVRAGLMRLAFGSGQDAVRLLFQDDAPEEEALNQMDFFNVAELKRLKNGGMEVKFFDRARAVEQLAALESRAQEGESPFCDAIREGAKHLWKGGSPA